MNKPHEIDIYTSLEEAKQELYRRWNDNDLRKEVAASIGTEPSLLTEEPKACLSRFITTPNFELFKFLELTYQIELKPVFIEHANDLFYSGNLDKRARGKLHFFFKRDKRGEAIYARRRIVDFYKYDGKPLRSVQTLWNESLIDFHHRLLLNYPMTNLEIFDMSNWCSVNGGKAKEYYCCFLSLFICNGVLFENFITNEEDERFSESVVFPALKSIFERFGLKPLVVPLLPHDEASDIYWCSYSSELEAIILTAMKTMPESREQTTNVEFIR